MVAPVATDWPLILSMAHDISNLTKTSEKANDQVEIFQGWQQVFGGFGVPQVGRAIIELVV